MSTPEPLPLEGEAAALRPSRRSVMTWAAVFVGLLAIAFALDTPVARSLHESGFAKQADAWPLRKVFKAPGEAWFVAIVAVALAFIHPWRWKASGFVALAAALSGLHVLIKWAAGRTRPYELESRPGELLPFLLEPFRGGIVGFFDQRDLSFPSGHTCTAFAFAAALGILLPRWRWGFYAVAITTALQRVSENAHFVSDVTMAAACGVGVTYGLLWCITTLQERSARRSRPTTPTP